MLPCDGLVLHADRLRAEQALGNLVDNALRHGDGPGGLAAEPARAPCGCTCATAARDSTRR